MYDIDTAHYENLLFLLCGHSKYFKDFSIFDHNCEFTYHINVRN